MAQGADGAPQAAHGAQLGRMARHRPRTVPNCTSTEAALTTKGAASASSQSSAPAKIPSMAITAPMASAPVSPISRRPGGRLYRVPRVQRAHRQKAHQRNRRRAAGEPVHAVGEIRRVGRGEDHQRGQRDVPEAEGDRRGRERHPQRAELVHLPQQPGQQQGGGELEEELGPPAQPLPGHLSQVVAQPDQRERPPSRHRPEGGRGGEGAGGPWGTADAGVLSRPCALWIAARRGCAARAERAPGRGRGR